jgi:hypothetical protein
MNTVIGYITRKGVAVLKQRLHRGRRPPRILNSVIDRGEWLSVLRLHYPTTEVACPLWIRPQRQFQFRINFEITNFMRCVQLM